MQRIIALLFIAQCAAFSTIGVSSGGSCIDEPDEVIAEETAKMGAEFAEYTTCAAISEAGGCERADAKAACCATCSLPARMTYGSVGLWGACDSTSDCSGKDVCQVSCNDIALCEKDNNARFVRTVCKRYVCLAIERAPESQQECIDAEEAYARDGEFFWCQQADPRSSKWPSGVTCKD